MADGQRRVLVAEDEITMARVLQRKLEHSGCNVTLVLSGNECYQKLTSEQFDVAIMDVVMPGMDGFQILEALQDRPGVPPIIVLSSVELPEEIDKIMALGAKKYLFKPTTSLTQIAEAALNI